ncbi:hypothetical protein [Serratia marcescens]|uniref:hypothetical protein n=1 Tax=Serratia marcescens TaxID=615 RepID=UPI000F7DF623|nr:hypothetical protein [Serratia marcescens]RTF47802.1 hypothetical protein D9B78_11735 [Serratia marcescens]
MDNKLSELSKPVAEVVSKFGDPEAFGERGIKLLTGIQQMAYGTKFYSQEYVSVLDGVAQFWIGESAGWKKRAEDAEKRIAELEQEPTIKHMRSVEEALILATDMVSALEAKLATPVRLLGEMLPHEWERAERQAAFEHRKIAWDARLEEDKKAILAAGFTFTVEGDA